MKLKSIYKFIVHDYIKGCAVFLTVILVLVHIGVILAAVFGGSGGFGGMESCSFIFMSLLGILTYRQNMFMSLQNGISRKTFYIGSILSILTVALIIGTGDVLISFIGNVYEKNIDGFYYDTFYEQLFMHTDLFSESKEIAVKAADYFRGFLLNITADCIFAVTGFAVGSLFYRLSRILKIVIVIGFVLLCNMLPVLLAIIDKKLVIINRLSELVNWLLESSYHTNVMLLCGAVISAAAAFLFIRRVPLNDAKK